jgi:hypothetical protein
MIIVPTPWLWSRCHDAEEAAADETRESPSTTLARSGRERGRLTRLAAGDGYGTAFWSPEPAVNAIRRDGIIMTTLIGRKTRTVSVKCSHVNWKQVGCLHGHGVPFALPVPFAVAMPYRRYHPFDHGFTLTCLTLAMLGAL